MSLDQNTHAYGSLLSFLRALGQSDLLLLEGRCNKLRGQEQVSLSVVSLPGLRADPDTNQSQWGFGVGRGAGNTARLSYEARWPPALVSLPPRLYSSKS